MSVIGNNTMKRKPTKKSNVENALDNLLLIYTESIVYAASDNLPKSMYPASSKRIKVYPEQFLIMAALSDMFYKDHKYTAY